MILDAAGGVLLRYGFRKASVDDVARAAGISRQGLYLHFATRGQLFLGLFDHVNEVLDLDAALRPIREAVDALAALDGWAVLVATYHSRTISLIRA